MGALDARSFGLRQVLLSMRGSRQPNSRLNRAHGKPSLREGRQIEFNLLMPAIGMIAVSSGVPSCGH